MLEPKNVEIDGMKFQLRPMPALRALRLDKKVISLLVPALGGLKDLDLEAGVDVEAMAQGVSKALERMPDEGVENLAVDLLSGSVHTPKGKAPQEITADVINDIFRGALATLYKLMFKIMEYNKFSPFVLVGGGNVMERIRSLTGQTKKKSESGSSSETSESSKEVGSIGHLQGCGYGEYEAGL
jgi:hypothetical protein